MSKLTPAPTGAGCVGSDTVLCFSGRFQVEMSWQTASGSSGVGYAANLTADSGYFWFFDPSNVEVVVKALDGCAIGSGEWFFAAGMTTVGVQLSITDTFTGDVKTYGNTPHGSTPGVAFVPILDTAAFSSCRPGPPQSYTVTIASQSNPCTFPEGGATANTSWAFVPPEIHIHVGDTITWTQYTGTHAVASGVPGSPDGMWYLGVFTGPSSTPLTFTQSGRFPYYCVPGYAVHTVGQDGTCGSASVDHEVGTVIVDP
jgi:plastocyanin